MFDCGPMVVISVIGVDPRSDILHKAGCHRGGGVSNNSTPASPGFFEEIPSPDPDAFVPVVTLSAL